MEKYGWMDESVHALYPCGQFFFLPPFASYRNLVNIQNLSCIFTHICANLTDKISKRIEGFKWHVNLTSGSVTVSFVRGIELAYKALHYSQKKIILYRARIAHMDYFVDRLSVPRHVQQAELKRGCMCSKYMDCYTYLLMHDWVHLWLPLYIFPCMCECLSMKNTAHWELEHNISWQWGIVFGKNDNGKTTELDLEIKQERHVRIFTKVI